MKKFVLTLAASFAFLTGVQADTSFLLIQGPFGLNGATETFKWQLEYAPGEALKGTDLLYAILGTPLSTGAGYWSSGDATQGAGYRDTQFGRMLDYFKLSGSSVAANASTLQDWNYYVAGGTGTYGIEIVPAVYDENWEIITPGVYNTNYPIAGAWTHSGDGFGTRFLADGSFDAWVYGTADWMNNNYAQVSGSNNNPTALDFADATVVNVTPVPEPGSIALVSIGLGSLVLRRLRTKK